jgi:hypothetical protein
MASGIAEAAAAVDAALEAAGRSEYTRGRYAAALADLSSWWGEREGPRARRTPCRS